MKQNRITPGMVRELVEKEFGISLRMRTRMETFVACRKIYYILACKYTTAPLTEISREIGFNHSVVVHHTKSKDFFARNYPRFVPQMNEIKAKLEIKMMEIRKKNGQIDSLDLEAENIILEINLLLDTITP